MHAADPNLEGLAESKHHGCSQKACALAELCSLPGSHLLMPPCLLNPYVYLARKDPRFDLGLTTCLSLHKSDLARFPLDFILHLPVPLFRRRPWPQRAFKDLFACPSVHKEMDQGTESGRCPALWTWVQPGQPFCIQQQNFSNKQSWITGPGP